MTPTDIERLAREAGMWQDGDRWFTPGESALDVSTAQLARFAALVEAAERERCANVCADLERIIWAEYKAGRRLDQHAEGRSDGCGECVAAIRGAV